MQTEKQSVARSGGGAKAPSRGLFLL